MKKSHSLFLLILLFFFSCKNGKEISTSDEQYNKGENLYDNKKYDDAFIYFYQAYQGYLTKKKYTDAAYSLIFLTIIQTEKGDFLGSNENLMKAAKYSGQDKILLTSIYNQFAINHNFLKNNKNAIYCYQKALQFSNNEYSEANIKNNIGISHLKMQKYKEAVGIFREISNNPVIKDSIDFRNRVLDNYAYSKFLFNNNYNAETELQSILQSRIKRDDWSGITSSLSHLADFYSKNNQKKSFSFAKAMYENAQKTGNTEDQLDALKKMIYTDEDKNVKLFFEKYRKLNDSIEHIKNNSKNQFTSVIYEAEKNKADILDSQNQILMQRMYIISLIAAILSAIFWYRKRRKQNAFEKELEIKNIQLKYSKKVHDVVANGLYHTMVEIQNKPELNKETVLNSIEKLYEESRDIARDDLEDLSENNFSLRLQQMLTSYSSDNQTVLVVGNNPDVWLNISKDLQAEIYYVTRELLVNMKKHSHAKFASVVIVKTEKYLQIKYTDNGIGMPLLEEKKKSGMHNMENRIEILGGKINFEPNPKGGLISTILIPIY